MGVLFYSSYGFANHLASLRTNVPEIYWQWERQLPFWAWSIVPYWTLNGFYAAAFCLPSTRAQVIRLFWQLLLAQLIAVLCFVCFPLTFTWAKPDTTGLTGRLFHALAGFDQPFNQAPSLHIMLTLIIGRFYWYRLPPTLRGLWLLWLLLIALSVLTTYQHHFIDIPTAVAAASVVLWLLPMWRTQAVRSAWFRSSTHQHSLPKPKRTQRHVVAALLYATLAMLALGMAWHLQDAYWWLLWLTLAWTVLACVYVTADAAMWQKLPTGKHTLAITLLVLPLYPIIRANMAFWLRKQPLAVQVHERLAVGSVLAANGFAAVVDVCAEYPVWRTPLHYHSVPCLDMVVVPAAALRHAANCVHDWMQHNQQPVLVCCALGYSRSVAVVLTYLVQYEHMPLQEAYQLLQTVRPQMVLSPLQLREIEKANHV